MMGPSRERAGGYLALLTAFTMATLLVGCFKPAREEIAGRGAREARTQQLVAPAEQLAHTTAAFDAPAASRLPEAIRDLVVAQVAGQAFTLGEFEQRFNELPRHIRYTYGSPDRIGELLGHILDFEVIVAEAREGGLDRHPRVLAATKQAMANAYLFDLAGDELQVAPVTSDEVRAEYAAHPERYYAPDTIQVRALALPTRAEAESVRARLLAHEAEEGVDPLQDLIERFVEIVLRRSLDGYSRERQGGFGVITSDGGGPYDVTPPLRAAAVELHTPGELSPVIEVASRFYLLLLEERTAGERLRLTDVEGRIRARLYQKRRVDAVERFVADLRRAADVEIDSAVLEAARAEFAETRAAGDEENPALPGAGRGWTRER